MVCITWMISNLSIILLVLYHEYNIKTQLLYTIIVIDLYFENEVGQAKIREFIVIC